MWGVKVSLWHPEPFARGVMRLMAGFFCWVLELFWGYFYIFLTWPALVFGGFSKLPS